MHGVVQLVAIIAFGVIVFSLIAGSVLRRLGSAWGSRVSLFGGMLARLAAGLALGWTAVRAGSRGGIWFSALAAVSGVVAVADFALLGLLSWGLLKYGADPEGRDRAGSHQFNDVLRARHDGDVTALVGFMQRQSDSPDDPTRAFAARSLGRLKNPLAVDALLAALDDSEFDVRAAAIGSLRRIGDKRSSEHLAARLSVTTSDAEIILLLKALRALGGQPAAGDVRQLADHPNQRVRRALARATSKERIALTR